MKKFKVVEVYSGYGEMGIEGIDVVEGKSLKGVCSKLNKNNLKGLLEGCEDKEEEKINKSMWEEFYNFVKVNSKEGWSTTWQYWNGSAWASSASTSQANSYATINTNLPSLALGSAGFLWQAVLLGNGNQLVAVDQVQILATEDVDAPTPPNTLTALSQSGGTAITTATWYNYATPYFSFAGADDGLGSGVEGYYGKLS